MKSFNFIEKIKENNFLIIGRAGVDIYPDPTGTKTENATHFVTHLGGSSANISVALTKLGGKCKLLTSVSDDALGRLAVNQLNDDDLNMIAESVLSTPIEKRTLGTVFKKAIFKKPSLVFDVMKLFSGF